jgi:hypothetical protein
MVGTTIKNYSRLAKQSGATLTTTSTRCSRRRRRARRACARSRRRACSRTELADFYVEYQLVTRLEEQERRMFVLSNLHQNIQDAFN